MHAHTTKTTTYKTKTINDYRGGRGKHKSISTSGVLALVMVYVTLAGE